MDMATSSSSSIVGSYFKCLFSSKSTKALSVMGGLSHPRSQGLHTNCFHFKSARMVARSTKMVSDVSVQRRDTNIRVNSKLYTKLDSCLVIPPTLNRAKPRAIIKFLGGAFVGAIPEATYGYLIQLLAKEGFLIVAVPYNVTFDHNQVAKRVYERFHTCLDSLLTYGLPQANLSPPQLGDLPLFSVST